MKQSLQQKQTTNSNMTLELSQAIKLLQYSTSELYDYIKEQAEDNPLIELKERGAPLSAHANSPTSPAFAIHEAGMKEKLMQQARLTFENPVDRQLVMTVIENLEEDGYLSPDAQLDASAAKRGIHLLQQIGPAGIGARTLKECLILQLTYNHPNELLARAIVENHLDILAKRNWKLIASALSSTIEEVKNAASFIQTLDPKPGAGLTNFQAHYVTPDVIVEIHDSRLSFSLNDRFLPSLQLNSEYMNLAESDSETGAYLNEKHKRFDWLVKSIEQRRATIVKIMDVIIQKQAAFFKDGFLALKPLTLKDVAIEIGMHESTISRATMNKIIQTPNGNFDLRLMFSGKLPTSYGDVVSQRTLQMLIKNQIDAEDRHKPLSDQKIADYLANEKGIPIARRTVAKYREQLKIPAAYKRKI